MITEVFQIKNKTGLHARPASILVKKALRFESDIKIEKGAVVVEAKSIISLLTLGAGKDDLITITTDGVDEKKAMDELIDLLNKLDD